MIYHNKRFSEAHHNQRKSLPTARVGVQSDTWMKQWDIRHFALWMTGVLLSPALKETQNVTAHLTQGMNNVLTLTGFYVCVVF